MAPGKFLVIAPNGNDRPPTHTRHMISTRAEAIAFAQTFGNARVFEKQRGKWHMIFDSSIAQADALIEPWACETQSTHKVLNEIAGWER
jgi:hypothetical protein